MPLRALTVSAKNLSDPQHLWHLALDHCSGGFDGAVVGLMIAGWLWTLSTRPPAAGNQSCPAGAMQAGELFLGLLTSVDTG